MPFLGARKHPGKRLGKVEPIGGIEYPTGPAGPGATTTGAAGPGATTTGAACWT